MSASVDKRLYYKDPWRLDFEARIRDHSEWQGRPSVLLDESAFYPESGGQLADHGHLAGVAIADVQLDSDQQVHHILASADGWRDKLAVGGTVAGRIDGERRRIHMAQHSGQHVLSRALLEVAKAETVSSRLGERACTIDIDQQRLSDTAINAVEALANGVVEADSPIRAYFPDADELRELPLRRAAKVDGPVRVVRIGDFDITPCGGTHCTRSAQIGVIHITQLERRKRALRLTFVAGSRARTRLLDDAHRLAAVSKRFSCGSAELLAALDKQERQAAGMRRQLTALQGQLAERLADELLQQRPDDGVIVAAFEGLGVSALRQVANRICSVAGLAAALASHEDDATAVIVARHEDAALDCGALLKRITSDAGGRGGGRPPRAEGKLPGGIDWPALVAASRATAC